MVDALFGGFLLAGICSKSKVEDMIAYLCRNATDKRGLLLWVVLLVSIGGKARLLLFVSVGGMVIYCKFSAWVEVDKSGPNENRIQV